MSEAVWKERVVSENETLRSQLKWAMGELRRIDIETAHAAIERREQLKQEEERKAAEEQERVDTAALEEHRVNCWINHRVDLALAAKDSETALHELLLKDPKADIPTGWPPGRDPSEFRRVIAKAPAPTKSANTALGAMLAANGAPI